MLNSIKREAAVGADDVSVHSEPAVRDTFRAFIDAVARDLDADEQSAQSPAASAYLSRSQFDRVIRAAAGEPPAFRRRILLERAAYRLASKEGRILDIALGAGYGSHEAFVRAFRRAYGINPSAWRSGPRQRRLPTPNNVHFHPMGGLRLPGQMEVSEMDLVVKMVEHHVWLVGQLVDRADRLDSAQLDAPIEISTRTLDDAPTIRSLLSRLVGQMDMWVNVVNERTYDFSVERNETIPQMRARLARAGSEFLGEVRSVVGDGRLDETFVDALCEPPEVFSYGGMIAHVLTFAADRRTQVLLALASAGITDLGYGDPQTWLAQAA